MTCRLLLSLVLLAAASEGPVPGPPPRPAATARIFRDAAAGTLVIDLAPTDLPANTPHHMIAQPLVAIVRGEPRRPGHRRRSRGPHARLRPPDRVRRRDHG